MSHVRTVLKSDRSVFDKMLPVDVIAIMIYSMPFVCVTVKLNLVEIYIPLLNKLCQYLKATEYQF